MITFFPFLLPITAPMNHVLPVRVLHALARRASIPVTSYKSGAVQLRLGRASQQHGELQECDQVKRVVVQHAADQPGVSRAYEVVVGSRDFPSGDVITTMPPADDAVQCLQLEVGELVLPVPSSVVEQVTMYQLGAWLMSRQTIRFCRGWFRLSVVLFSSSRHIASEVM